MQLFYHLCVGGKGVEIKQMKLDASEFVTCLMNIKKGGEIFLKCWLVCEVRSDEIKSSFYYA